MSTQKIEEVPVIEKFLELVRENTQADKDSETIPSSKGQIAFSKLLRNDILKLGVFTEQVTVLPDSSFMVYFGATPGYEGKPHLCIVVHMDTSPDAPGDVTPLIHENYSGGDIILPKGGTIIPANDLKDFVGQTIITSSGDSLLGADDKAGVASLIIIIKQLIAGVSHGRLTFLFCADEEIGKMRINDIPKEIVECWDIILTVDGSKVGNVDTSCYHGQSFEAIFTSMSTKEDVGTEVDNGQNFEVTFTGAMAHPGIAPEKIKPAHLAAACFTKQVIEKMSSSVIFVTENSGDANKAVVKAIVKFSNEEVLGRPAEETLAKIAEEAAETFKVKAAVKAEPYSGIAAEKIKPAHLAAASFVFEVTALMTNPWEVGEDGSYVYVTDNNGNADKAVVKAIPRSFDAVKSDQLVKELKEIATHIANGFEVAVEFKTAVQYVTTKTAIDDNPKLLQVVIDAHNDAGVGFKSIAVKAGTDGAMINKTYSKIPAPNMGAGGFNFHSCQEFLVVEQLSKVPEILMNVIIGYANFSQ